MPEKRAARFREFKNCQRAARCEDAPKFTESGRVVRQVAESKGRGQQIEGGAGKRKRQRIRNLANYAAGLREFRRVLAPGGSLAILEFAEPRGAFFRHLFNFYFKRVLPAVGAVVSGHAQAYSYLPESVARFPDPSELAELMKRTGFCEVAFE